MKRRIIGIVCIVLSMCMSISAQQMLSPTVEIVAGALPEVNTRPLDDLKEHMTSYLQSFVLPVSLSLIPKQPIPVTIRLTLKSGNGQRYVGDVEVVMFRPIYGSLSVSPILHIRDVDVPFEITSSSAFASYGSDLPTDPLLLRIVYFITEGLAYYYDSFGVNGGNPIVDYMNKERSRFASAWEGALVRQTINTHTPDRWLMEMESPSGKQMRELWYIYHREVLDSERVEVAEENLSFLIPLLSQLHREQQIPLLFRLFSDSKASEMASRIEQFPAAKAASLKSAFREVFPTFVF